ncbi:MAG TPA: hypothetical protein PK156_49160, partial [Polyangium sp.]|nr:hypothetical protein [Polyangium sp.]
NHPRQPDRGEQHIRPDRLSSMFLMVNDAPMRGSAGERQKVLGVLRFGVTCTRAIRAPLVKPGMCSTPNASVAVTF